MSNHSITFGVSSCPPPFIWVKKKRLSQHIHRHTSGGVQLFFLSVDREEKSGKVACTTIMEDALLSGEEEGGASGLPKNTKVIITGNNRTKSFLIGLHAVVKNTAGVRGWHWLVLPNGLEVKLQRNALSVIELPNEQEEDKLAEFASSDNNSSSMDLVSDDFQKIRKPKIRPRVLVGSSRMNHGSQVQSTDSNIHSQGMLKVDLSKLETSALWRYWKHFNLVDVSPNPSKDQLIGAVERHFISQQLDEFQVISGFVQAAKRLKTVCSQIHS
ncbi:hypothetical protein SUGI_1194150 [Cryptomeria japonica]|uniref:uncharacterized protein LOC131039961 n=1 Tax=Cryptomeria japonica TaxID=3369 RepID=UPI002414B3B0|nr:uncharacterized protein LOC131039961 [Cryptomeria japonica]GLJ55599.1 hypothetical protein SUGI_1194150 [Cryptomeria japonica]